jgi:hypothetical protein
VYVVLLAPSSNRVYAGEAERLVAAELTILLARTGLVVGIEPAQIAGVRYLEVSCDTISPAALQAIGATSGVLAMFERAGDALRPVELVSPDLFDDDLVTIPKYPGKTNEQFTRLMLNVTLASADTRGRTVVLDPLCGRGTTLSTALTLAHDACGVEVDAKAVEAYAGFLRTYLRRKRLKHSIEVNPVRREGRSLGRRLDVAVRPAPDAAEQTLCVFTGDTRDSAALYGKRSFSAIVTDAPYGVAHGSRTDAHVAGTKRDRSPAGLLREAIPVWASQLRPGGALGLSWNTVGLGRAQLTELVVRVGLEPLDTGAYLKFEHRVDSSIHRDLLVARRPRQPS